MTYDGFLTGSGLSKVRVFSDFSDRSWPDAASRKWPFAV